MNHEHPNQTKAHNSAGCINLTALLFRTAKMPGQRQSRTPNSTRNFPRIAAFNAHGQSMISIFPKTHAAWIRSGVILAIAIAVAAYRNVFALTQLLTYQPRDGDI